MEKETSLGITLTVDDDVLIFLKRDPTDVSPMKE